MTIAISLKVNDGVVLAADSAAAVMHKTDGGAPVASLVYNNANKVFNIRKGLPIGLICWGAGAIGKASLSTLIKDLRLRFTTAGDEWHIDPNNYQLSRVADLVRRFVYEEHYFPVHQDWETKPVLGMMVAGYSAGAKMAEEYRLDINSTGECTQPVLTRPLEESGASWSGEPEAISRLLVGYSQNLPGKAKEALGLDEQQTTQLQTVLGELAAPILNDAMPIQDAIDLAEFLVYLTKMYSRFTPGGPTVGGPIEIAAITKHEGFKWVSRKHYFTADLNYGESTNG